MLCSLSSLPSFYFIFLCVRNCLWVSVMKSELNGAVRLSAKMNAKGAGILYSRAAAFFVLAENDSPGR